MKRTIPLLVIAVLLALLAGCGAPAGDVGTEIISAEEALELVSGDGVVLVDARTTLDYRKGHVEGAVSISRADIVVMEPVSNLLAPAEQIEAVMSDRGISNDTLVVIYDDNSNMDSARLWWTLRIYGHDLVKVVSGGLEALRAEGVAETDAAPVTPVGTFTAAPLRTEMLATQADVRAQVNEPGANTVIIDTRSEEEFAEGTIPGSVCLNFTGNNFSDGTFRPVRHIQIRYLEAGVDYDQSAIMFCKSSIRGAQTYLAMYNAGYRDLKLYDGAWLEWSANPMNEIYVPEGATPIEASDAS